VPAALTAETRNTYAVPLVSPVTVADADADVPSSNVVHDTPASDEYSTTQSVTTDPPVPPAVHDNATCVLPPTPLTAVGAPGVVYGVTDAESADAGPVPAALTAETRNTYAVPLVSPVTVADAVADVPSSNVVHVTPASDEYSTTQSVTADPPVPPAVHDNATCVLPPTPLTAVGAPGVV
jgi:hypothetical protein